MAKRGFGWRFFRAGGVDQVVLRSGEDVARLRELDQKLWVALACPTRGTELDEKTLALIDADHDGRVRAPDVLAAVEWCAKVFKSLDLLFDKGASVPLSQLSTNTDEGKAVLASAKRILHDQNKGDVHEIGLDEVTAMEQVFVATRFNGDGIVPADSAGDEATKKAIEDIMAASGSVVDRSGKPGVDQTLLDAFFQHADALLAWHAESQAEGVLAIGAATAAAAAALTAVRAKAEDYYTRCRVAAYEVRAAAALNPSDVDLAALSRRSLSLSDEELGKLPLARVEPNRALPLEHGLNPAWTERVATFARTAVVPLLGARDSLAERDFAAVLSKLEPFQAWQARKPAGPACALEIARVKELVARGSKATIDALIQQDAALQDEYAQIASVERAVRFRRDLLRLLRNFVSFADFYGRKGAVFQAGTLYLDGRACSLTVLVHDAAKHAALASLSKACLAYCECQRAGEENSHIVAAFTAGDIDNLMVGRNGVFYDRKGRDWDARITSIIANPISVRQAFWGPYKRLVRMVEEQVAKRATEKDKETTASVDLSPEKPAPADAPGAAPAPKPVAPAGPGGAPTAVGQSASKIDVGMVAAIGVAVAGTATFLSSVLATFLGLGMWMPIGLLALLLAISGPAMLVAWLKLRQRNLGPILDANGWAINGLVRINVPFGGSLTQVAQLPKGSTRAVADPYAEKPSRWRRWTVLAVVLGLLVLWVSGKADPLLPDAVKASKVLHRTPAGAQVGAPAPVGPPAATAMPAGPGFK